MNRTFILRPLQPISDLSDAMASMLLGRLDDFKRKVYSDALWIGASAPRSGFEVRGWPVEGEIEQFPYPPESLDLIVVNGCLNRVNDLPGVLVQMRRALRPDGLFLCAFTGGETLYELRNSLARVETSLRGGAAARVHPMVDLPTLAGLMQRAGYALPVVDTMLKKIYYKQFNTLLKDIKASGEGLALQSRSRGYVGRGFWPAVEADYRAHYSAPDGLLEASIEILFACGWGPAATQQKPLKPGTAQHRLAEALGTTEGSLPDKSCP